MIDWEHESDSRMGDVALLLGWEAPEDDGGFWIRGDSQVHDSDLRPLLVAEIEQLTRDIRQERLEFLLDELNGPRESFRALLTDSVMLVRHMCDYAEMEARRKRREPWSIISDITGHGSGVSGAIYELYRREKQ